MNKREFIILIAVLIFGVIFLYIATQNIKDEYISQKRSLLEFELEAKELQNLTKKYDNQKESYRYINSLKNSYHVAKEYKKRDILVLEFDNLNKSSLNSLIKKIANSSLVIKKIVIFKESQKAILRVEIKI